ncbi:MAG: pyruvate dehydrogenase (acetyl-transferring) E1 component subunit alpha [Deltaproteobacteria bacterium]|nr:pyruvate dehydrogenase (acetyl-transferring) E1 component subunit alpha [Deltaproteobacteria bacterium]
MSLTKKKMIEVYETMLKIRMFEDKVAELFGADKLPGFVHLYAGEEAIATGVCAHLTDRDYITSTHRGHGHCIAKGVDINSMMAEVYGKATGACKGKGGSMHIADVDKGMLGANGIVGAGGPLACGSGLMAKTLGTDQVTVCFFGDGAAEQGTMHESMNLACCWALPVIFVCENNGYAETTPCVYHCSAKNISDRGVAYDIPGITVDGSDFFAVYEAAEEAIGRARKGEGPSLIECRGFRYYGHFQGDSMLYFTEEEKERNRDQDPIESFKKRGLERKLLTKKQIAEVDAKVAAIIEGAVKFAEDSAWPAPEELFTDVYVNYP